MIGLPGVERFFQLLDPAADGTVLHAQLLGCCAHRARFHHHAEYFDIFPVHERNL